jgi:hypothetical protein
MKWFILNRNSRIGPIREYKFYEPTKNSNSEKYMNCFIVLSLVCNTLSLKTNGIKKLINLFQNTDLKPII